MIHNNDIECFILYDDSYEYANIMDIIYKYVHEFPQHFLLNMKIVKLKKRHEMKYALLFHISENNFKHIHDYFNENLITIKLCSENKLHSTHCISEIT